MASRKKVLLKVCMLIILIIGIPLAHDSVLQVIILGDSGVGKTSLMNQYVCQNDAHLRKYLYLMQHPGQQEVQRKL